MRAGKLQPGIKALFAAAGREPARATTFDLGFALGPRLNAAGRLADMALGIECLITDDMARALQHRPGTRRSTASGAASKKKCATALARAGRNSTPTNRASIACSSPNWHQGVIGILAGPHQGEGAPPDHRLRPRQRNGDGELKGSGRSIPGCTCATRWIWSPSAIPISSSSSAATPWRPV
jgi:single-stranded-DNA-specific exonuclease